MFPPAAPTTLFDVVRLLSVSAKVTPSAPRLRAVMVTTLLDTLGVYQPVISAFWLNRASASDESSAVVEPVTVNV